MSELAKMSKELRLETIADGALAELFAKAVDEVMENIQDLNTDAEAKRRITLTLTFSPNEQRNTAAVGIAAATKLAGVRSATTTVFMGRHEGVARGVEALSQGEMFTKPAGRPSGVIEGGAGAASSGGA